MRASEFLISTLREAPQDALTSSHQLMIRSGLVRKMSSGLYYFLPLGVRVIRKIEATIRKEMNRAGALECILPILIPADLWQESGRWKLFGSEMFRLEDRHKIWNALGPTHEESITHLVGGLLQSYRDLPLNLYQIHTKFRDEIRPRFGVIRSREFIMKDAYSFHRDEKDLEETYCLMRKTYRAIFRQLELNTITVEADSGSMGGGGSEEFMVPSEIGEETLLISKDKKYHGNQEKTPLIINEKKNKPDKRKSMKKPESVHTPDCVTIEDIADFLKTSPRNILKTVVYRADNRFVAAIIRADRQINEIKLKNQLNCTEMIPATDEEIIKLGSVPGYIGPVEIEKAILLIFDNSVLFGADWIIGANKKDFHYRNYNISTPCTTVDIALAVAGDPSPAGGSTLEEMKGIEVGHIFKLGDKYTKVFDVSYLDEAGRGKTPIMGTYGIGVNRTMAAIIEQNHDVRGIIWPLSVAPFEVIMITITSTEKEDAVATEFYKALCENDIEVMWDDRDLRPGVKFNDSELIGYPIRITMGKNYFKNGNLEIIVRKSGEKFEIKGEIDEIIKKIKEIKTGLIKKVI